MDFVPEWVCAQKFETGPSILAKQVAATLA